MIDLHYWTTPNGDKILIALEELGLPSVSWPDERPVVDLGEISVTSPVPNSEYVPPVLGDEPGRRRSRRISRR